MSFPIISDISDVTNFIQHLPQIRVKKDDEFGLTVICYMLQDDDTFSGENESIERECRGITFGENGKIVSRHLHKFFNVGEREDTLPEKIDWTKVTRVMEKRDGSMVVPVPLSGGGFKFKTKKSFQTNEAQLADTLASSPHRNAWIAAILNKGLTPTFEVTSPRFPIVLRYDTDELTLLHVRENMSGRYLSEPELVALSSPFPLVKNYLQDFTENGKVSWDKLKHAALTMEKIEGWVIQFESGDMVKLKTQWYNELHRSVTFTRWRDIARAVVEGRADDLKAAFTMVGKSTKPIAIVQRTIQETIDDAREQVVIAIISGTAADMDAKEMAQKYIKTPLFSQIMKAFRGQEIDWIEWYSKNRLESDWGLEVIE